jgi:hypothetical protein
MISEIFALLGCYATFRENHRSHFQESSAWPFHMGSMVVPKHCITSQKSEDLRNHKIINKPVKLSVCWGKIEIWPWRSLLERERHLTPRCPTSPPYAPRHPQMPHLTLRCPTSPPDAPPHSQMLNLTPGCPTSSPDAPCHSRMPHVIPGCTTSSPDAPRHPRCPTSFPVTPPHPQMPHLIPRGPTR